MLRYISIIILSCFFCLGLYSENVPSKETPISIEIIHEKESIQPGQPFWVALHVKIADQWHTYWKNPGEAGMPLSVEWDLPEGFCC